MKLLNLSRRTSRKTRIAQLEAEVAQLTEWNLQWQDHAAYLAEQCDQYDALARDLADELSAAQAVPAHVVADEDLTVLAEVSSKFPILTRPFDIDFTGEWRAIDLKPADDEQKALPVGSAA